MATAPLRAQSAACQQIRAACKDAGFVQGGPIGDRLVLDCFDPIVLGQYPKIRSSRPLPKIDQQLAVVCKDSLNKQSSGANAGAQMPVADKSTLTAGDEGRTVHDAHLGVTWLADANLAATESFGVSNINKSGSMNFATAVRWVGAMNAFHNGAGYLGHNNWQLPTAPSTDKTCELTGRNGESFGYYCSGSALGSLYYVSFGLREPDSAVANSDNQVGPFQNFQPYLYWSKSQAIDPKQGFVSFSFSSGFQGANVFRNYLYVLPMIKGKLPGAPSTAGSQLQANPDGKTVYDPITQVTWLADANLAATQSFGIAEYQSRRVDESRNRNSLGHGIESIRWWPGLSRPDRLGSAGNRTVRSNLQHERHNRFWLHWKRNGIVVLSPARLARWRLSNRVVQSSGWPLLQCAAVSLLGLRRRFGFVGLPRTRVRPLVSNGISPWATAFKERTSSEITSM